MTKKNTNVTEKNNATAVRGPGRPVIETVSGYKVKVGLRYLVRDKRMTVDNMSEGDVFRTEESAQKRIDQLVKKGVIKVWGGRPRAKLIERKTM